MNNLVKPFAVDDAEAAEEKLIIFLHMECVIEAGQRLPYTVLQIIPLNCGNIIAEGRQKGVDMCQRKIRP